MTEPGANPLQGPPLLSEAMVLERARARAATARDAGEWFDIYTEIVEQAVKRTLESAGEGHLVLERLADRRAAATVVRREFQAHGLPLSEDIDVEGPLVTPDPMGFLTNVSWPRGQWVRFIWPDQSKLEFRGMKAVVALAFIMWWENFHLQFQAMHDKNAPQKRRVILPHTPEWDRYMAAKAADQARVSRGLDGIGGAGGAAGDGLG
jgi:xanthine/CO dehydrogenase XdhC/CoxF family maturation factor